MDNIDFNKVELVIENLRKQFGHENSHGYYHYTGVSTLFKILETDSFRASNIRFSNDDSEERIMEDAFSYTQDDYIVCFCSKGDLLSQWRGYCYDGGVSIEFEMLKSCTYSLISPNDIKLIVAKPLPVIYCPTKLFDYSDFQDNVKRWMDKEELTNITHDWFFPYLKNDLFAEENELRLVFSSKEGELSEWIQYRDLSNGIKLPYITVMHGNQLIMRRQNCMFDINEYSSEDRIKKIFEGETVWIPEGQDQKSKYYELKRVISRYARKHSLSIKDAHIFCRGHLPIRRIIVSPSYEQTKLIEQISHYCSSKYWLKDVIVEGSKIPYIRPVH